MIPDGNGGWLKTKADELLPKYDKAFGFWFDKKWIPLWRYIEAYEKIRTKRGKVIPFRLNDAQIKMYSEMAEMKLEGKPVRINDGKGRQMGGSTLIAGMFWALTAFSPDKKCGIVADTEDHGIELLNKYRLFYQTTPERFKRFLRLKDDNSKNLSFEYGEGHESTFKVVVQGANAGNSMTFNYLHESEVAKWQSVLLTIGTLDSTVDPTDPESIIIRETTAYGAEWKSVFRDSQAGKGSFRAMFVPWWLESGYASPYDGHDLNQYEEQVLIGELGLSLDQCQFWRTKFHDYGESYITMGTEYPSTVEEMFQSTQTGVFDPAALSERFKEIQGKKPLKRGSYTAVFSTSQDGKSKSFGQIKWVDEEFGPIQIFEEPIPGHPYIMNCDPAMGGKDEWAVVVIDNSNCRQVAIYAQSGVYESQAVQQSYCLYERYAKVADVHLKDGFVEKRVMACGEVNTTESWCRDMAALGCKVYISRDESDIYGGAGRAGTHYGYKTKTTNRQVMIDGFRDAFRDDRTIVSDFGTLEEMENFQYVPSGATGKEKAQATGGYHDDRVMAFAGFFLVRHAFSSLVIRVCDTHSSKGVPWDPLAKPKRIKTDYFQEW